MSKIFMPFVGTHIEPVELAPRGFGIGIRWQEESRIPTAKALELLRPPLYFNWLPWAFPGVPRVNADPRFYPMSWNPPRDGRKPDGTPVTADQTNPTWLADSMTDNAGRLWLVGNEPQGPNAVAECHWSPQIMAAHCNALAARYGIRYAAFGGVAMYDSNFSYAETFRKLCHPTMETWHIYPDSIGHWLQCLERVLCSTRLPVIVNETSLAWGTADDARHLMDKIMWALDKYEQLHAVMWFVHFEPDIVGSSNMFQLLRVTDGAVELTKTGRHYLAVRGLQ